MQTLTIPEPVPSLNVVLRKFRDPHARKKEQNRWDWMVRAAVASRPCFNCCEVTVYRLAPRQLDWDNMCLKFLMDALVHNGIIADDNPKVVVRLHLEQEKVEGKFARTRVEIIPLVPNDEKL